MAKKYWKEIPKHFSFIKLDAFIIMPNHIHGILMIRKNPILNESGISRTGFAMQSPYNAYLNDNNKFKFSYHQNQKENIVSNQYPKSGSMSVIIRSYKSMCRREINKNYKNINFMWHRNFYDHIIRTQESLWNIREYIKNNPKNWENDRNYRK